MTSGPGTIIINLVTDALNTDRCSGLGATDLLRETAVEVRFLPRVLVELWLVCVVCPFDRRRVARVGVSTPPSSDKILLLLREQVFSPLWGV